MSNNKFVTVDGNNTNKRVKIDTSSINYESMKALFARKIGLETDDINTIHYKLEKRNEDEKEVYHEINDDDDVETLMDEVFIELNGPRLECIYMNRININNGQINNGQINNDANARINTTDKYLSSAIAKLALTKIPYHFSGKDDENINHFQENIRRYSINNNIKAGHLFQLLMNGTLLLGAAFNLIQDANLDFTQCESDEAKLKLVWNELEANYPKANHVLIYKQQLQSMEQTSDIKTYLKAFKIALDKFKLEVEIQKRKGNNYHAIDTHELAEYLIRGLKESVIGKIFDESQLKHKTSDITYEQICKLLHEQADRILFIKAMKHKIKGINNINNTHINTSSPELPYDVNALQLNNDNRECFKCGEIGHIARNCNNKSNNNRGRGRGNYNNRNRGNRRGRGSYGARGSYGGRGSYGNGRGRGYGNRRGRGGNNYNRGTVQCKHGPNCNYGLECQFYHTETEKNGFRTRNNNNDNGASYNLSQIEADLRQANISNETSESLDFYMTRAGQ